MTRLLQPFPCFAAGSTKYRVDIHAPLPSNFGNILVRMVSNTKLTDLCFSKLNFSVFFATVRCAVINAIHAIVGACRPSQMPKINTLAISTIMCRIAQIYRTRTMRDTAYQPVNTVFSAVNPNSSVTAGIDGERPFNASIGSGPKSFNRKGDSSRAFNRSSHFAGMAKFWALVNRRFSCLS